VKHSAVAHADPARTFHRGLAVSLSITRLRVILACVLLSGALTAPRHLRAAPAGAVSLAPAHFAPAAGWQQREGRVHACVGVSASRCLQVTSIASTTRFRDCLECLPHHTVAAMHARDIAIQLTVAVEHPLRAKRTFAWPPRVRRRTVVAPFEGLPAQIGVYQGTTLVGRREVSVFIVFGRAVPTDRQLKRANAELRRLRFG
jgi:hypothetical protein